MLSDVFLSKTAFQSRDALYLTIGHEYIHVRLNYGGQNLSIYSQERVAYQWSIQQGQAWGMDVSSYQAMFKSYWQEQSPLFLLDKSSIRIIRPW